MWVCDICAITRGHQGIVPVVAVSFFPLFKQQMIAICTSESRGSERCQKPPLGVPAMAQHHLQGSGMLGSSRSKTASWNQGAAI